MPAVGKTALATFLAHRFVRKLAERAEASSLTLVAQHVDLHAFGATRPADPYHTLRQLLISDGLNPRDVPTDPDALENAWRKHLVGRFIILVLDDARDEKQVEPFLPGGTGHIVLVTSRRQLLGLRGAGALPIHLQELEPAESEALITTILRRPLADTDKATVSTIASLCGNHPMAMTLAVAGLAGKPQIPLSQWMTRLTDSADRQGTIARLVTGEDGRVAQMFTFSYRQLPSQCQLLLRRMSLSPAPDVTAQVAGILIGQDSQTAEQYLLRLEEESRIEDNGRWYRLHDLIRQYARQLTPQDGAQANAAAIDQVLTYYYDVAAQVDAALTRQPPPPAVAPPATRVGPVIADRREAIEQARTELPNLLACGDHAQGADNGRWAIRYATALAGLLRNEGLWPKSIQLQTNAIEAATDLAEPLALANALHERGLLYRLTSELASAEADLARALAIYDDIGGVAGLRGKAHVLNTCAVVIDQRGNRRPEARRMLDQSLALYRQIDDRLGEANVLNDSGMTSYFAGHDDDAIDLLGQALQRYEAIDQPLGQAHAHSGLARALRRSGRNAEAIGHLETMARLYNELGNRLGEASTLVELVALRRSGLADTAPHSDDPDASREALTTAADLFRSIGNWIGVGTAYLEPGRMYIALGEIDRAGDYLRKSLDVFRRYGVARDEDGPRDELRRIGLEAEPQESHHYDAL
jgi:tetratricopeptide (TPR) repeat protein